jgi:hypothetical protein
LPLLKEAARCGIELTEADFEWPTPIKKTGDR